MSSAAPFSHRGGRPAGSLENAAPHTGCDPTPDVGAVLIGRPEVHAEPQARVDDLVDECTRAAIETLLAGHDIAGGNRRLAVEEALNRIADRGCRTGVPGGATGRSVTAWLPYG